MTLILHPFSRRRWYKGLSLLACLALVLVPVKTAFADPFVAPDPISNRQKAHLNVAFTGGGDPAAQTAPCTGQTYPGGSNDEIAFHYFVGQGFTEKQAAGIIGNYMVESSMMPNRVQGSGMQTSNTLPATGGYGIAQWDDRKPLLKKFADNDSQKRPIYDLTLQLDFTMWELKNTEKAAFEAFKTTSTIREATDVWREKYERPGVLAVQERRAEANIAYGKFATEVGNPTPAPSDPTQTGSCGGSGSIVAIAQAELAKKVLEDPIGCDAGNPSKPGDCGAEVNKYTDSTLEYWCADFVSWVYKQAGTPFTGGASGGWRIASVEGVQALMEEKGTFYKNNHSSPDPKPGDVYVINNGEHIGIVVKVANGTLYTISGNTSTDNYANGVGVGDAAYPNYKSDSRITGYGGLQ